MVGVSLWALFEGSKVKGLNYESLFGHFLEIVNICGRKNKRQKTFSTKSTYAMARQTDQKPISWFALLFRTSNFNDSGSVLNEQLLNN